MVTSIQKGIVIASTAAALFTAAAIAQANSHNHLSNEPSTQIANVKQQPKVNCDNYKGYQKKICKHKNKKVTHKNACKGKNGCSQGNKCGAVK